MKIDEAIKKNCDCGRGTVSYRQKIYDWENGLFMCDECYRECEDDGCPFEWTSIIPA